jgi:hypothetical protein
VGGFGSLRAFSDVARFHDLVWWAVEYGVGANPWQRNWPYLLVLGCAIAIATIRFRADWRRAALWSMGLTLVLSPVLHPWYATWILPLACLQRAHAWSVLAISAMAGFLLWESTTWWNAWEPNWVTRTLVIVPPLIAWLLHARASSTREALT